MPIERARVSGSTTSTSTLTPTVSLTEMARSAAAEVATAVKDTVGTTVEVDVVDPETLARSMGKLQRLFDHRDRAPRGSGPVAS